MSRHVTSYGAFHIDALPGQPQVAHCHSFFVESKARRFGLGHRLKEEQKHALITGLFDFAICTVDGKNKAQKRILTKAGWKKLSDFFDRRAGSTKELWGLQVEDRPQ